MCTEPVKGADFERIGGLEVVAVALSPLAGCR